MHHANEILLAIVVIAGIALLVGGTILARKPERRQEASSASEPSSAALPWWAELLGPDASPTPEDEAEILARLILLDTPWSRSVTTKAKESPRESAARKDP